MTIENRYDQLVDAAREVIYRQGFAATTLADVAEASSVPLGSLYYYFKTKDDLAEAVVDACLEELRGQLDGAAEQARPEERLIAFLRACGEGAERLSRYGCPFGTLTEELEKRGGALASCASRLFEEQLEWMTDQFRALDAGRQTGDRALELMSGMQGAIQVAVALQDRSVIDRRFRALEAWIHQVAGEATERAHS